MSGLIFSLRNRFIILAKMTPLAVPAQNATSPSARMARVSRSNTLSATSCAPMVSIRKMVET